MQYTSGTTGRPKAVQRDLPQFDPETWVAVFSANLTRYDIEPGGDAVHLVTSPMYHLSPLSFGYFSLHLEHPVVLMERWDAERALQLIERHRVTDVAMVPTQLHRLMALPEDVRGEVRRVVAAPGDPRRGAVPDRAQAPALRLARPGDLRVLRRLGGRRHAGPAGRLARAPGHGRSAVGRGRREGARRRRQRGRARDGRHRVPEAHGRVLVQGRSREDRGQPPRRLLHRRRHGRARRRRLPLPARPQDRHDHLGRGEHLPGRGGGGLAVAPGGGGRCRLRHPRRRLGRAGEGGGRAGCGRRAVARARGRAARPLRRHAGPLQVPRSVDFIDAMPRDPNGKLYKRTLRDPYWVGRARAI